MPANDDEQLLDPHAYKSGPAEIWGRKCTLCGYLPENFLHATQSPIAATNDAHETVISDDDIRALYNDLDGDIDLPGAPCQRISDHMHDCMVALGERVCRNGTLYPSRDQRLRAKVALAELWGARHGADHA